MGYSIDMGKWGSVFAVPSSVVDEYMKLAGAAQLKVLLYLLRHGGEDVTVDQLAFAIGQKPSDTQDAFDYWVNCGLLRDGRGDEPELPEAVSGLIQTCEAPAPEKTEVPQVSVKNAMEGKQSEGLPAVKEKIRYSFSECMKFIAEDSNLKNMLNAVEAALGKQLTHTEVTSFVTLVKWHGMPCTVVPMLAQYCKSIGKPGIAYIEATGIGWTNEEIDNFEKAERKITALTARRNAWNTVRSALEIPERKATENELKFCDLWINAQHIEVDLIRHAYDKCINKNGKLSFAYMNGIIKRYYDNGITDAVSALRLDEQNRSAIQNRPAAAKQAKNGERCSETYDTADIEAILDAEWDMENENDSGEYNYDD